MYNEMNQNTHHSNYTERDDLDWDDILSPDEYLDHLDRRLFERSQGEYK